MASGHNLTSGKYIERQLSDDEMWSAFANLFSNKSVKNTSYKFGFLKAILDNLYNVDDNLVLTFDQLFLKFAEIYWNLVLKHHISQRKPEKLNRISKLETVLYETQSKYDIQENIPFESITNEMKMYVCKKTKSGCKGDVVGALYADLNCLFYSFEVNGTGWIQLNPQMYRFVCKHKVAIEKLNYYEWARFLEKVNSDEAVDHLLSKIDESTMRTRKSLMYYRDILFKEFENKCFYCGNTVQIGKVEVDHFIPWSFIKDDNLWNFVLACRNCNNKKRDKLADVMYLDQIEKRNAILVERNRINAGCRVARITNIYNWARQNGYSEIWVPNKVSDK